MQFINRHPFIRRQRSLAFYEVFMGYLKSMFFDLCFYFNSNLMEIKSRIKNRLRDFTPVYEPFLYFARN